MNKIRITIVLALALTLLTAGAAQAAQAYVDYGRSYDNLIGAMEVVNCSSWASLRSYPDSSSARLAKVPLGAVVINCYYQDERFTYCEYNGIGGYILNTNLSFIYGPIGYEYSEDSYMGNMQIVNCVSYASLRDTPAPAATCWCGCPWAGS